MPFGQIIKYSTGEVKLYDQLRCGKFNTITILDEIRDFIQRKQKSDVYVVLRK